MTYTEILEKISLSENISPAEAEQKYTLGFRIIKNFNLSCSEDLLKYDYLDLTKSILDIDLNTINIDLCRLVISKMLSAMGEFLYILSVAEDVEYFSDEIESKENEFNIEMINLMKSFKYK